MSCVSLSFFVSLPQYLSTPGAENSFADRFAIDSTSGNLYYTSASQSQDGSGFKGVSVISPKGDNRDLVSDVDVPRDIVVDPQDGYVHNNFL